MDGSSDGTLRRALKARHITMIALGGTIGTGLFVALGGSLSSAGAGGTLTAYLAIGIMVYFLMTSLGEMSTYMPVSGSFETYASRFIDPALGFALGWNYWINWAVTLASELVAAAMIIQFWFPDTSSFFWSALFLIILVLLNVLSAQLYGESEFWFAGIKVVTVIVFLLLGVGIILGILGGGPPVGFENWQAGDGLFPGGMFATFSVFLIAGYSFMGTEVVGVAAGESANPRKDVPKAIHTVFWRILLFYIGTILVIGFLMPYNDPDLLKSGLEAIGVSPFTLVFERAGMAVAASVMNAVILTAVLSCGNTGLYAGSRMLYALALEGKAPKFLARTSLRGVPYMSVAFTAVIGMMAFLTSVAGTGKVYVWLVNGAGLTSFIAWLGIAWSHYRFRRAYIAQGHSIQKLPYASKFFPLGPWIGMGICAVVIIGQAVFFFAESEIDWGGLIVTYSSIPLFLGLFLWYKKKHNTHMLKLEEVDFSIPADVLKKRE